MLKLVVLCVAVGMASAGLLAPLAYPYSAPLAYSAPLLTPYSFGYNNYRGPLSLAPGQPANILAADGRPLDTLDVNLDRSAHLTAKALSGSVHLLKKRSASLLAAPLLAPRLGYAHAPLITPAVPIARIAPISHVAPISYRTPYFSYY